jgi:hypothetical protein
MGSLRSIHSEAKLDDLTRYTRRLKQEYPDDFEKVLLHFKYRPTSGIFKLKSRLRDRYNYPEKGYLMNWMENVSNVLRRI